MELNRKNQTQNHPTMKNQTRDHRRLSGRWGARMLFLLRILGMAGLLAASASVVVLNPADLGAALETTRSNLVKLATGEAISTVAKVLIGGLAVAAVALLVELLRGFFQTLSGRSGNGLPRLVELTLAVGMLGGINWIGFEFHNRYDGTRGALFTLPPSLAEPLSRLQGNTRVVVLQRHRTLAGLSDRPDRWDLAAERKIVEKVNDLASLLRESGPGSLKVDILDVEDEDYEKRLNTLTASSPKLRQAIEAAPENSIFFHGSGGKDSEGKPVEFLQQLGFAEFLRLDKTASQEFDNDRGNLVLLPQGVPGESTLETGPPGAAPFVRRLLNLQERQPRVAIGVIDEWLSTKGVDSYGLAGLRKSLTERGFDVRDLVLKKIRSRPAAPVVYTFDESRLDRIEARQQRLQIALKNREKAEKQVKEIRQLWKDRTLAELERAYAQVLRGRRLSEANRTAQIEEFDFALEALADAAKRDQKLAEEVAKERATIDEDAVAEQRRMSDLQGKLSYLLADVDLLILPRPTLSDVITDDKNLPGWLHSLDAEQVAAVKDFLKRGRPILVASGPTSEMPDAGPPPPGFVTPDGIDNLLAEVGFRLGKQTILFDVEAEAFGEQMGGVLTGGTGVQVPPLMSSWKSGIGRPAGMTPKYLGDQGLPPHPIRASQELAARSLGKDRKPQIRLRHPRPIYFEAAENAKPIAFDPDIMMTSTDSWNEDRPFPTAERIPSFEAAKDGKDDPAKGTIDARRRGPFPVGAAVEATLPPNWFGPGERNPGPVRMGVLGESWFLVGPDLGPYRERLALDTINWLIGRDDSLARPSEPWTFPRIEMEESRRDLWRWGMELGLPVLIAFAGVVVLLTRRLR